jgi:prophage regulatory protein
MLRLPALKAVFAMGTTAMYDRIAKGLMTPPVKPTPRTSCWPEEEVAAVRDAVVAGKSEDEIKVLVKGLMEARQRPAKSVA